MLLMCKQARTPVCIKIDHSHYCHPAEAWKSLTDKVQEARSNARLKELSFEGDFKNILKTSHNKKTKQNFFWHIIRILSTRCRCKWVENAGNCPRGSGLPA